MRTRVLHLAIVLSISAVCAVHGSEPNTTRRNVGNGENPNHRPGETATTAQLPPRTIYSRQTTFAIPFTVDLSDGNPLDVLLYVSTDYGRTWGLFGRQPAAQDRFVFRAPNDGEYWFASRTTGRGMHASAGGTFKPELSVVVDTKDPRVELQATVDAGGEIKIICDATDPHLASDTLKVEYQAGLTAAWRPVPIQTANDGGDRTALHGETSWQPGKDDRIVSIRATVRDKAENNGEKSRRLIIPLALAARGQFRPQNTMSASTVPSDPFARYGLDTNASQEHQSPVDENETMSDERRDTLEKQDNEDGDYGASAQGRQAEGVDWPTDNEGDVTSQWQNDYPPHKSSVGPAVTRRVPDREDTSTETFVDTWDYGRETRDKNASKRVELPQGERAHMTRSKRFNLDYSIDDVGPLGVEKVELWVTRNGGRDWDLWGLDEDRESPFSVSVDEQGIYGFRIVIVGRNGLASETPRGGDAADLWVGVDTKKPEADIKSAAYGSEAFAGHLDVQWTVTDDHLGTKPITLMISEKRNGPWTPIASGLSNTGQHHWRVDSRVPDSFYLRLEARDEAGNVATRDLDKPIKSAGMTPKGHVRGFKPVDRYRHNDQGL